MLESDDPPPSIITLLPPLMRLSFWNMMEDRCVDNCSGHGDCYQGVCFCEVQYSGGSCTDPNLGYFIAFSSIFYIISVVSFVQLLLCVKSEYGRMKSPSVLKACRITTQKALYILICIATSIRGFYFSSPENAALQWTSSLLSAYYPVLITGSSLIVCFWAEVFHLQDKTLDRPSFLSKSFFGFLAFNIITYSLLMTELVLLQLEDRSESEKNFFTGVFNGLYAGLMLIVVIFFLVYGTLMYFQLRGGFVQNSTTPTNTSQLHQSRVGLVSQGVLLLITVAFIISDTLGSSWKDKVPVLSRNCHDVIFRVVEMGVALWFPCVLWNCVSPEQLWILNPKKILMKLEADKPAQPTEEEALVSSSKEVVVRAALNNSLEKPGECWICYDSERQDVGPLIQPCLCKGDVSAVHHDCLKKWLEQSSENPDNMSCKVCKEEYKLERGTLHLPRGLTKIHWLQTSAVVALMCTTVGGACLLVKMFNTVAVRTATVGVALLVQCICLRLLGFSFLTAYHRAKFSTVRILENKPTGIAAVSGPQTKVVICTELRSNMDTGTPSERTLLSTVSNPVGTEVTI
ncbi:uncharacterized protein LOC106467879 [Limulus polyphemus]|uniref:Uncharacterized protein LOC106467879 n=1 Tax=Limulus polyphemus TaxID=6850 RepID=A0ABM1BKC7_LIMPO|nr:uncharacterized protein LOC106467879 [Limulus polyphemus]XP_022252505.1 uncharacterized protein LOC106467879 [Limulus polyphemus]XP_022252509.1 uncharacterized protein LOC106467879 [Limulus polyphemus]XP_022252516.1 uncharacterized protein LOC106467879 [Limulus polyphemus]XP_022252524.1 uncharacterized protein LOC106467879 [Limulus polyphemus]